MGGEGKTDSGIRLIPGQRVPINQQAVPGYLRPIPLKETATPTDFSKPIITTDKRGEMSERQVPVMMIARAPVVSSPMIRLNSGQILVGESKKNPTVEPSKPVVIDSKRWDALLTNFIDAQPYMDLYPKQYTERSIFDRVYSGLTSKERSDFMDWVVSENFVMQAGDQLSVDQYVQRSRTLGKLLAHDPRLVMQAHQTGLEPESSLVQILLKKMTITSHPSPHLQDALGEVIGTVLTSKETEVQAALQSATVSQQLIESLAAHPTLLMSANAVENPLKKNTLARAVVAYVTNPDNDWDVRLLYTLGKYIDGNNGLTDNVATMTSALVAATDIQAQSLRQREGFYGELGHFLKKHASWIEKIRKDQGNIPHKIFATMIASEVQTK